MATFKPDKPRETLASLIIDDPLLRPKYGCLEYERLLQEMKIHRFFTEIAFIPWNYKRSNTKTVEMLANNPDYYAVCVHGCNHTYNEFGCGDYRTLFTLSSEALWRMEQHKKITGLSYDPVIVFPQGLFSSVAIKAIKDSGYRAAFNSKLKATDGKELPDIEYQKPATTIYHDFPLFLRRYSCNKEEIFRDISLGRPIIIVEHHGIFKSGYRKITDFVDWLNNSGNIRWTSLNNIVDYYYQSNNSKPYTENHIIENNKKVAFRRYLSELRDNYIEPIYILDLLYRNLRCLISRFIA